MQERDMLEVIRSLAAEEHRLRDRDDEESRARAAEISTELAEMWSRLRTLRAESGPIDLGAGAKDTGRNLAS